MASSLGTELVPTEYRTFASGEILTRFEVSIRGCDFFLIQSFGPPVNEWLMETLIMLDAAKRASAKRITVVAPYYPYSRQDKKSRGREPISARLVADLLKTAGADRVMSVDLHAAQIQGFFDGPVDHLFAKPVLLEYFERTLSPRGPRQLTVVSPDTGRVRVADTWSDSLGAPLAIIHKRRDPNVANQVTVNEIVGQVDGRVCLLVDDMIDTGGTIVKAAEALKKNGARSVIVAATHAIFSDPARRAAAERGDRRGRRDRHGPDPRGQAVPDPHDPPDRAAAGARDPRGLRGRLGHEHVRRRRLTPPEAPWHSLTVHPPDGARRGSDADTADRSRTRRRSAVRPRDR